MTMRSRFAFRGVSIAVNVPGPVACAELVKLGASIVKIEPPSGDPLKTACRSWYNELHQKQRVLRVDLKTDVGIKRLHALLKTADFLMTSSRPDALERLGLTWKSLHRHFPKLHQIAIEGYETPNADQPGHDLTYQAALGLLGNPPRVPATLIGDLTAAQRVVQAVLVAMGSKGNLGKYHTVSIEAAARWIAKPFEHGMTKPLGLLGGAYAGYQIYKAKTGFVAIAFLEKHFLETFQNELRLKDFNRASLEKLFKTQTAKQWETWAKKRDLPIKEIL